MGWDSNNPQTVGLLLGLPQCTISAFNYLTTWLSILWNRALFQFHILVAGFIYFLSFGFPFFLLSIRIILLSPQFSRNFIALTPPYLGFNPPLVSTPSLAEAQRLWPRHSWLALQEGFGSETGLEATGLHWAGQNGWFSWPKREIKSANMFDEQQAVWYIHCFVYTSLQTVWLCFLLYWDRAKHSRHDTAQRCPKYFKMGLKPGTYSKKPSTVVLVPWIVILI